METSPAPVKGWTIYTYAWRPGPLSWEGSLSCHTCCDTGPRFFFFGLVRRITPFSRFWQHAWGCWIPIVTRILTGSHKKSRVHARHYSLDGAAVLSVVSRALKFKSLYVIIVNRWHVWKFFALFVLIRRSFESKKRWKLVGSRNLYRQVNTKYFL
jgi:hypothetical protein